MTSPNFNIDLTGAENNSCRVARARSPRNDHTDIFGVRDNQPNFNIGLTGAEKNSCRVVRARSPRNDHTDIFGIKDNQNDLPLPISNKRMYPPQSTISSCFNMVEEPAVPTKRSCSCFTKVEEPKVNEVIANGDQIIEEEKTEANNGIDENKALVVKTEKKQPLKKEEEICRILVSMTPTTFNIGLTNGAEKAPAEL